MDAEKIIQAVKQGRIEWSAHSFQKMLERGISGTAVKSIINQFEIIEDYSNDKPFPSALLFGMYKEQPLHTVISYDDTTEKIYIITAYIPDNEHFESDFKTRKRS